MFRNAWTLAAAHQLRRQNSTRFALFPEPVSPASVDQCQLLQLELRQPWPLLGCPALAPISIHSHTSRPVREGAHQCRAAAAQAQAAAAAARLPHARRPWPLPLLPPPCLHATTPRSHPACPHATSLVRSHAAHATAKVMGSLLPWPAQMTAVAQWEGPHQLGTYPPMCRRLRGPLTTPLCTSGPAQAACPTEQPVCRAL